jgi:hypothetical protein
MANRLEKKIEELKCQLESNLPKKDYEHLIKEGHVLAETYAQSKQSLNRRRKRRAYKKELISHLETIYQEIVLGKGTIINYGDGHKIQSVSTPRGRKI